MQNHVRPANNAGPHVHAAFDESGVKDLTFHLTNNTSRLACQTTLAASVTLCENSGLTRLLSGSPPNVTFTAKGEERATGESSASPTEGCRRLVAPLLQPEQLFSCVSFSLFSPRAATSAHAGLPPGNVSLSFPG